MLGSQTSATRPGEKKCESLNSGYENDHIVQTSPSKFTTMIIS